MKKNYILAALAVLAVSCQINPDLEQEVPQGVTIYLNGEKPEPEAQSKTYYDTDAGTVLWSQTGEKLAVAISDSDNMEPDKYSGVSMPSVAGFMSSNEAIVSEDGKAATFSITFDSKTSIPSGGTYRFHTVYPESASFCLGNWSIWDWGVWVGTRQDGIGQFPPVGSFDPAADVMLGISKEACTEISDGMNLDMVFERLVTHGKITLTNLQVGTVVSKAVITAPQGCTMSGIYYINVMNKDLGDDKANYNYVILNYYPAPVDGKETKAAAIGREVGSDGTFDLWFCTKPTELSQGDELKVSLYTATGIIERTITARESGIKFEKNKLSTLKINMSEQTLNTYFFELRNTADGPAVDKIELPRTGGKTTFYIRTNAGQFFNCNIESAENVYSLNCAGTSELEDGTTLFEMELVHKPNHSISTTVGGSIPVSFSCYGSEYLSGSIAYTQAYGEGAIVNSTDDWTADPVQFGSLLWYPVNVGFDRSHPYGKYFQYRRYAGQYPYCDDNSTNYAVAAYNNYTEENDRFERLNCMPDDDTFYGSQYWWEFLASPRSTHIVEYWPDETTEESKTKGIGNPCPEGWRLPTRDECTEFLANNIGWKVQKTVSSHCGASFAGDAYVWEFWNKDMDEYMEFPIAGYINGTYTIENSVGNIEGYRAITEAEFQALDNASLKRYGNPVGYDYSYYWVSDPYNGETSAIEFNSRGYSNDVQLVNRAWPGWGCSVRCVKPVE
ncbi:MAG: hypothetical protein ACI3Y4_05625 [Candidatus Cryptobacteroides sp.]